MCDVTCILWLIPALPLAAAALIAFAGPRWLRHHSHWPCIVAVIGSCVLSVIVLAAVSQMAPERAEIHPYYTWFRTGNLDIGFSLRADALTAIKIGRAHV